jgi:hypothetical protein
MAFTAYPSGLTTFKNWPFCFRHAIGRFAIVPADGVGTVGALDADRIFLLGVDRSINVAIDE